MLQHILNNSVYNALAVYKGAFTTVLNRTMQFSQSNFPPSSKVVMQFCMLRPLGSLKPLLPSEPELHVRSMLLVAVPQELHCLGQSCFGINSNQCNRMPCCMCDACPHCKPALPIQPSRRISCMQSTEWTRQCERKCKRNYSPEGYSFRTQIVFTLNNFFIRKMQVTIRTAGIPLAFTFKPLHLSRF